MAIVTLTWLCGEGVSVGYCQIHTRSCDHRHPARNRFASCQTSDNYQDSNPGPLPV